MSQKKLNLCMPCIDKIRDDKSQERQIILIKKYLLSIKLCQAFIWTDRTKIYNTPFLFVQRMIIWLNSVSNYTDNHLTCATEYKTDSKSSKDLKKFCYKMLFIRNFLIDRIKLGDEKLIEYVTATCHPLLVWYLCVIH
jgi:HKD family nuclease